MFKSLMFFSSIGGLVGLLFFTNSDPKYFAGYAQLIKNNNPTVAANKTGSHSESVNGLNLAKYRPSFRE